MSTIDTPHRGVSSTEAGDVATSPRPYGRAALGALRLLIGWTFLWAFFDKLFGLGYATPSEKSWLNGGSPTLGFLKSSEGPFSSFYHSLAGTAFANFAFMAALLLIGTAMMLGIAERLSTFGAVVLFLMMWTVVLPPPNNPFADEHLIQAVAVLVLAAFRSGQCYGLARWWDSLPLVRALPILK